ncbi:hypothetical protein [Longimicrobium sp.]|uniref:hypothetical protein n=1 Tax=Longimicrobium sp. TaxID=2029185 RepID=UPI002CBAC9E9|nr:hypothetical protein [Longimicrobium sp.]HSU17874.1 hypothetical protein [Longimicrobium sp.]
MTIRGLRATARSHEWLDERSRALHVRVGEKLRDNPALVSMALANLDRWERQSGPDRAWAEWREILTSKSISEIVALLQEDSENANRLRQSSPFAGALTEDERMAVFREYAAL